MKRALFLITALLSAIAAPLMVAAQDGLPPAPYAYRQIDDPAKEAQARELMHTLRCLVCQGQSIADSDAPLAGDMRSQVRERIIAGESPDAIRQWLVARYGSWVSYEPPLGADTLLLYLAPVLALIGGGWIAFGRLRRRGDEDAKGERQ
jgi:cytochrome c-type biogenesis protein CcmH